jgi:hypothetical protein
LPLLLPVNLRLADAIGKIKWFISVEIAGSKPDHLLECVAPSVTFGALDKRIEVLGLGEKHHHEMWFVPGAAPIPTLRGVMTDVTQQPPAVISGHTGAEFT